MKQSIRNSWLEIATNTIVGFIISLGIQLVMYPMLDLEVTMGENISITLIFMSIGILRSYIIRRIFNKYNK
jgi:hypothetical protein